MVNGYIFRGSNSAIFILCGHHLLKENAALVGTTSFPKSIPPF